MGDVIDVTNLFHPLEQELFVHVGPDNICFPAISAATFHHYECFHLRNDVWILDGITVPPHFIHDSGHPHKLEALILFSD